MIKIDYSNCTACGACKQVCPSGCISIEADIEGFLYPVIDVGNCIECGACEAVCPINKDLSINDLLKQPIAYAAIDRNIQNLLKSTSGGIFGCIAEYILTLGGSVYGCSFNEKNEAIHIRIANSDQLDCLRGSKYVQSNTRQTFKEVKKDLNNGLFVLFSGTPCQIAGLKSFIGDSCSLFTVDLVCHGVGSQAYFNKWIKYLENKNNAIITELNFRSKKTQGWLLEGDYTFKPNGKFQELRRRTLAYFENYYYFYFLRGDIYRESCYCCNYATINRVGDFTLGDFWGVERLDLNIDVHLGCSMVLVNTERAKILIEKLPIQKQEVPILKAIEKNGQLSHPSKFSVVRKELLKEFREVSGAQIQKNFIKNNWKAIVFAKCKQILPRKIKQFVIKVLDV
ncbi:MAG: Coenzyme F420 hydrogenase/dehydrogenase, beta subunit C-terminal domain [Eubacteriales bacterium]